jgi:hypothetical protein
MLIRSDELNTTCLLNGVAGCVVLIGNGNTNSVGVPEREQNG